MLGRLSWPHRGSELEAFFGRSRSYISIVFNDVIEHLHSRYGSLIAWHPSLIYSRLKQYALYLNAMNSRSVWGFIDGTLRPMCRPIRNQQVFYTGYKKLHGFKYQGIITPDGLILSCMGPFEAKMNDTLMFRLTNLRTRFQELFAGEEPLFLYGDSPYESCYRVIAPYKRTQPLSRDQIAFNRALSSDRISVEQVFGCVTRLWRANSLAVNLKTLLQPVALYYSISVLLTNIYTCLHGNMVSERYNIQPLSLDEYLRPSK